MREALKSFKLMDGLLLAMAVWVLAGIDFDSMSTLDTIYLVTFSIWIVLLAARLVLAYRRARQKEA